MNDDVRIYLVDEYCAGASHFCFSERKDVVLLEDYEKLRAENEKLKGELNCAIMSRDWAWDENSRQKKKNEKLRCLALHLFERVAFHEFDEWDEILHELSETSKEKNRAKKNRDRWLRIHSRCESEYRKAKEELKEGK